MTTKEKATELVESIYYKEIIITDGEVKSRRRFRIMVKVSDAKRIATMCVDEVLNTIKGVGMDSEWDYWQDVKQEIEEIETI